MNYRSFAQRAGFDSTLTSPGGLRIRPPDTDSGPRLAQSKLGKLSLQGEIGLGKPMPDSGTTIAELREEVQRFVAERTWEVYHSPKNLVMGLAIETAELMEHFLWVDSPASREVTHDPAKRQEVAEELADVACHLLNLCNALEIDLSEALQAKMLKNALKYPVEKYRGRF